MLLQLKSTVYYSVIVHSCNFSQPPVTSNFSFLLLSSVHRSSRFGFFKGFLGFFQRVSHKNKLYKCTVIKICCYSCKTDCGKSHSGFIAGSTVLHIVPVSDGVRDTRVMPSRRQQYQIEKSGKKGLQDEGTSRGPEMSLRFLQDARRTRQVTAPTRYCRK